jgi:uncharacterized protein HemX
MAVVHEAGQEQSVRLAFLRWLAEYFYAQGVGDPELWKLLQERQLQTTNRLQAKGSREDNKHLRVKNRRIKELESSLAAQRRRARRLKRQKHGLVREMQNLDRQLTDVRNSRLWRLTRRLGRIRAALSR